MSASQPEGKDKKTNLAMERLLEALHQDSPEGVKEAIRQGADPNGEIESWRYERERPRPIHAAMRMGALQAFKALLAAGADPRRPDAAGKSAADWALSGLAVEWMEAGGDGWELIERPGEPATMLALEAAGRSDKKLWEVLEAQARDRDWKGSPPWSRSWAKDPWSKEPISLMGSAIKQEGEVALAALLRIGARPGPSEGHHLAYHWASMIASGQKQRAARMRRMGRALWEAGLPVENWGWDEPGMGFKWGLLMSGEQKKAFKEELMADQREWERKSLEKAAKKARKAPARALRM